MLRSISVSSFDTLLGGMRGHDLLDVGHVDDGLARLLRPQHLGGADLVDHVDRLVGQLAVVDVARRQLDRRLYGVLGVGDVVVLLVDRLQALHDQHGVGDRGLRHVDLLETADQGAVLLEVVAVFLVGGRADAAQLARLQRGLEEVRRIHRAARRRAGADDGVDLVDEQHRVGLLLELGQDGLEPLLEVAAIARASQQRAHVERVDHRLLQDVRHIALDDLAGQPLGNGGLADARLTNIERIVLGAPAQHLDGALDLVLATNQRVDAAVAGFLVEVDAVRGQRLVALLDRRLASVFLLGSRDAACARAARHLGLAVADVVHGVEPRHALVFEERHGVAVAFGEQRHEHVGAGHFLAAGRLHMDGRALDHALEACRGQRLARRLGDDALQAIIDESLEIVAQPIDIDPARLEDGRGVIVLGHRQQQMLEGGVFVTALASQRKCAMEGLLEVLGQHGHRTPRLNWVNSTLSPACIAADADSCARNRPSA
jgi:hypothetical protein